MNRLLALAIGVLIAAIGSPAQTSTGTIVGTVADSSGAVIAGAQIEVVNSETGAQRRAASGEAGSYTVPLLPPRSYRLTVTAQGFKKFEQAGIELRVQQQAQVDVNLQLGESSESVLVQADAAVVEATTSSVGKVVDNRRILSLPLNTRNA